MRRRRGRLTPLRVRLIREALRLGVSSTRTLAQAFCVSERAIQYAAYGDTWSSLPGRLKRPRKPIRRLTPAEVLAIASSDRTSPQEAARYGIAESTVRHIRTGRIWSHLTGIPVPEVRDEG